MEIKIATYNIHKGLSIFNRRLVIHELREQLHTLNPDIVFLQEVQGAHHRHGSRFKNWPTGSQQDFLAEGRWPEVVYVETLSHRLGHHGNALLSRFTFLQKQTADISAHRFEGRSLLHCVCDPGGNGQKLHCINVHLGLTERGRRQQLRALCDWITEHVPEGEALVLAGDFNDWRHRASEFLSSHTGLLEVHANLHGAYARTYPARMPMFGLDRIYVKNCSVQEVHSPGSRRILSDHAPLVAKVLL